MLVVCFETIFLAQGLKIYDPAGTNLTDDQDAIKLRMVVAVWLGLRLVIAFKKR